MLCPNPFPLHPCLQGSGNENLQQVSALFGLNYASVLADNQGVISSPNEPLAGRSVLLCGTTGRQHDAVQVSFYNATNASCIMHTCISVCAREHMPQLQQLPITFHMYAVCCSVTGPPRPVQATPRPGAGTTAAPTPRGSRTPSAAAAAGPSSATPQPLAPSQLPAPPAVKPQVSPELQKQGMLRNTLSGIVHLQHLW